MSLFSINSKTRFITNFLRVSQVMMNIVYFEGVNAKVRNINFKGLATAFLVACAITFVGCGGPSTTTPTGNESAATVNGKAIKMEEVERAIKAQGGDQVAKLSPLELATARLQIVQQLIQQLPIVF